MEKSGLKINTVLLKEVVLSDSGGNSKLDKFIFWVSVGVSLFHIWFNTLGSISDLWRNSLHMGLLGFLGFLIYPPRERGDRKITLVFNFFPGLLILAASIYLIIFERDIHIRYDITHLTQADLIFAAVAIILSLEVCRRTVGLVIPVLALIFVTYVLWWGDFIGGAFQVPSLNFETVMYRMFVSNEGLFGIITTISSTFVFMFIIFAAFLLKSGGGDFIINIAQKMTRKVTGGPGIVAVVGSGLMGTISGSAIANTVSTGAITIPMMKKAGFKPEFAAGIETAASVGGQLMPPVMGAGAFVMAQYTQLPYTTIIAVAFLPAVMYFASVGFYVYFEARKYNLKGLEIEGPSIWSILREGVHFLIPIIVLVTMLIIGYTPTYCAGFATLSVIFASWLSKEHRMGFKEVFEALNKGTRNMITTGLLLVVTGLIVGAINLTGKGITFSYLLGGWASSMAELVGGGELLFLLLFITVASMILGMGLPVTAAYIMISILSVPALQDMGVSLIAAHMIIFWVSQDSNVTPPVCLAAFAAAAIAGSPPMKTGFVSWKLAKGLYIMPLLFAYTVLIEGGVPQKIEVTKFEHEILKEISKEEERAFILTSYVRQDNLKLYVLKKNLTEDGKSKVAEILKSKGTLVDRLQIFIFGLLGLYVFAAAMIGFLAHKINRWWLRLFLYLNAFAFFVQILWIQLLGLAVFGVIYFYNRKLPKVSIHIAAG